MKRSLLIVLALVAAACGGSDESASTTSTTEPPVVAETTTTSAEEVTTTTTLAREPVANVWPLTGLEADDDIDVGAAPVIMAKIDNTPSSRPQTGLAAADIVFDVLVEGGVSRFIAVYQSDVPDEIGPIRSGREVDSKLIEAFGGMFVYSGGQDFVVNRLRAAATDVGFPRLGDDAYYRATDRPPPYDVIVRTSDIIDTEVSGFEGTLFFGDMELPAGEVATEVSISMSNFNQVSYVHEGDAYLRFLGGDPHLDRTNEQIATQNVIVLYVNVLSTGRTDSSGSPVPDYDVVGSGEAIMFRDGRAFPVTWNRDSTADLFRFFDADGVELALAPGKTWIELVPTGRSVDWK